MTIRLALHRYRTDPDLPQKDGVNLAHENITQLMSQLAGHDVEILFHDFNRLIIDGGYARDALQSVDVVVSNVGPHAHYYFWLREKFGFTFRIVRDVRTAIWSSYLLQEWLVRPYLRKDDGMFVASNYCWAIYLKIFPWLADHPMALCYPLSIGFPPVRPEARIPPADVVTLGYLGRLSDDKNFPDIVELLIRLNRNPDDRRRYRLLACGDVHSPSCQPDLVRSQLHQALGNGFPYFEYVAARSNDEIWDLLDEFDVMLFPSTSNLETFGRVLIEASFARLPVIAGGHAAAPELIDPDGLCAVKYRTDVLFESHFDHCLGGVDLDAMQAAVCGGKVRASDSYEDYRDHPARLVDFVVAPPSGRSLPTLHASQQDFMRRLRVTVPPAPDLDAANRLLPELARWFLGLQRSVTDDWETWMAKLRQRSRHVERTERFVRRSLASRGDFTNVGGVDIELCHIAEFYPTFSIAPLEEVEGR